jgi:hypothetical protein
VPLASVTQLVIASITGNETFNVAPSFAPLRKDAHFVVNTKNFALAA